MGWREYVYWQYWRLMPGLLTANAWQHQRPLPGFFWDGRTEMNCLRHVVNRVLDGGYSHHIERLMIICNFCLLAGIDPAAVNDWFLACYVDAYEWVVTPNVIGMGLNADGGQIATKPYIASANYINKMSDYCRDVRFNPRKRDGRGRMPVQLSLLEFPHRATRPHCAPTRGWGRRCWVSPASRPRRGSRSGGRPPSFWQRWRSTARFSYANLPGSSAASRKVSDPHSSPAALGGDSHFASPAGGAVSV